uniref:GNAT family N-acetyltransferase n=1 Tax=Thaumasiovibrio subtropicus TaxID=1891207 RepID=UPI00192D05E4|nr:GNAT family N-acetyltransferase [Thaumasiovibrio subtropicus]
MQLLYEADPNPDKVASYLPRCRIIVAVEDGNQVGVAALLPHRVGEWELINLAVSPDYQKKGIGATLLEYVIDWTRAQKGYYLGLGTGTFGYQLAFYQRAGFRVERVIRNFFLDHYPHPVWEAGIQHQDMLWLGLKL